MAESKIVTDPAGRQIEVQEPSPLERVRFTRLMGKALDGEMYRGQAIVGIHVRSIDGVPVMIPNSPETCDALIAKLEGAWDVIGQAVLDLREQAAALNKDEAKN